jgi:transcription-repair coupling factor (superfamily II helicase)
MTLKLLLDAFERTPIAFDLRDKLPPRGRQLTIAGLVGSSPSVLAAWLARAHPGRLLTIVATTPADAERWLTDLAHLTDQPVALYPQREALGEEEPHYEIAGERAETLAALFEGRLRILVTTVRASQERTLVPARLRDATLRISRSAVRPSTSSGQAVPRSANNERQTLKEIIAALETMGYERVPIVTEVAQFSVRGGIVDVYGFGMAAPARLEWWGDDLESMRSFDLTSQRSGDPVDELTILPIRTATPPQDGPNAERGTRNAELRQSLLELLPSDTLLIEEQPHANTEEVARSWREAAHHLEVARRLGEEVPTRADLFEEPEVWGRRIEAFPRLAVRVESGDLNAGFFPPERIERDIRRLRSILSGDQPTLILCDNEGQLERLDELLSEGAGRPNTTLAVGALDGGFIMRSLRVFTDHEIFRRARRIRRSRRYRQAASGAATGQLQSGDYVVHLDHGIGIYRGIDTIQVGEAILEVAIVEYEGGDRLNVPLYRLDQLERYRSAGEDGDQPPPRLHKLGGSSWQRVRDKTRQAIQEMAAELLDLYARRKVSAGYAFPPDTRWQRELESSFLYEDTPDQRKASEAVKRAMEQPIPMDLLLVGDVGYGKTEVAVRAAFKAVQGGKQVAVLVPTTILADQHARTFTERLADFPVKIEVLSRFRTAKAQKQALERLTTGEIDIIIGTHRLLSPDVQFKDLGLLVVDEEHRFGVKHKERLKTLRLTVDVLTLTATPIPRTLHLSLAGLRDLVLIETPPRDRSPILTFVEPWDDALLDEAFARELDRGGQVFVVHNRIETIETIAARVRALAPRASVAVGHGQMAGEDMEEVMRQFVSNEAQILVSTMIVESGLDVPNANTMVVHDAHRFGLAQLYQLRGRVGRSHRRAYCYLLVPDLIDQEAEERLRVLEHHTDLGAGYRIALKDLELRGAGNLLGAEQSGHAHAVGFDLYLRWLEETVKAIRGQGKGERPQPPEVVLDRPATLSDSYVADDAVKLDFYRRLARAGTPSDIEPLRDELRERFGPLPESAEQLLDMARLRVIGAELGLQHLLVRGDEARLTFREGAVPRFAGLSAALDHVQLAVDVRRTVPLSLRLTRLGGQALVPALVRALTAVAEKQGDPSRVTR